MTERTAEAEMNQYLWPLTGESSAINWASLVEELRIRRRLGEILAHVRATHLGPRLRRLRVTAVTPALTQAITESVIAGPDNGPPWTQTLKEPVPRALREEWNELAARLRDLHCGGSREQPTLR